MTIDISTHKNILLNQINYHANSFKEVIPNLPKNSDTKFLSFDNREIRWSSIKGLNEIYVSYDKSGNIFVDCSINLLENNKFRDTEIYYSDGQIGLGRIPLYSYKVDIEVPANTLMTALHIGDGSFGFSMGNGTTDGFIPEIIGMGSDENDAGLYFLGKTSNNLSSDIPLIILDGRGANNTKLKNRPILGVTSANYEEYKLLLDNDGTLTVSNIFLDTKNLLKIIEDLQKQISDLEDFVYSSLNS